MTEAVPKIVGKTGFFIATVSEAAPEVKVSTRSDLFTYQDTPGKLADATKWLPH